MAKDLFRIVWEDLARAEKAAARRRHVALSKAGSRGAKAAARSKKRKRHRQQVAVREIRKLTSGRMRPERGGHWVLLERMEPGRCYTVTDLAALMPEWGGGYRCVQPWLYQKLEPQGLVEKVRIREYTDAGHRARVHLFVWRLTTAGAAVAQATAGPSGKVG